MDQPSWTEASESNILRSNGKDSWDIDLRDLEPQNPGFFSESKGWLQQKHRSRVQGWGSAILLLPSYVVKVYATLSISSTEN